MAPTPEQHGGGNKPAGGSFSLPPTRCHLVPTSSVASPLPLLPLSTTCKKAWRHARAGAWRGNAPLCAGFSLREEDLFALPSLKTCAVDTMVQGHHLKEEEMKEGGEEEEWRAQSITEREGIFLGYRRSSEKPQRRHKQLLWIM